MAKFLFLCVCWLHHNWGSRTTEASILAASREFSSQIFNLNLNLIWNRNLNIGEWKRVIIYLCSEYGCRTASLIRSSILTFNNTKCKRAKDWKKSSALYWIYCLWLIVFSVHQQSVIYLNFGHKLSYLLHALMSFIIITFYLIYIYIYIIYIVIIIIIIINQ